MLDIFFKLIIIFITIIGLYYATCHILKLLTGCDDEEAVAKIQRFFNGTAMYSFNNDYGFINNVSENIKNIIGEKRFEQLINLSKTAIYMPLIFFGENSGLPYVAISVYYKDENEKQVIENIMINLVIQYLKMYGYCNLTLVNWTERPDLKMPVLEIKYARTREEKRILDINLQNDRKNIIDLNTDITDDDDGDDLDE